MRTALVSDMHGNCVAFDAVLAEIDADPPDQVVCLGDIAQGGPHTVGVELGDGITLTCFHGSPQSFHDVLLPEVEEQDSARCSAKSGVG